MTDASEAILFNGPDPNEENKYVLIKYFPKSGVEERVASFQGSVNNGMAYLDGSIPNTSLLLSIKQPFTSGFYFFRYGVYNWWKVQKPGVKAE